MSNQTSPQRYRQSVSLMPDAKGRVARMAQKKGVSANRAIEDAISFYSKFLDLEEDECTVVGITIKEKDGKKKQITVML